MSVKFVVTVSEMARMVGLSRARFYQLLKAGVFPQPSRNESTGRPQFGQSLQDVCLQVRKTNRGVSGGPVLFYARKPVLKKQPKKQAVARHAELIGGLKSLGLATANETQVQEALGVLYPQGSNGRDSAEVLRAVFVQLMKEKV